MRAMLVTSDGCSVEIEVSDQPPPSIRRTVRRSIYGPAGVRLGEHREYKLEKIEPVAIYREKIPLASRQDDLEEPLVDVRERELRAEREAEADARMRERSRRGGVS